MIQRMRFGFWMPVFGGWLRNVEDEGMPATFAYQRELAQQADRDGWDVTLIVELNLNDIKGPEADCLEAWTTAAALAPLTEAHAATVAHALRRRGIAPREGPDRARVRRLSHARRPARGPRREDRRHACAPREASRASAAPVRCRRIRHRSQQRRRRKE